MLVADLQELEEVKTLITKGQQLGVLTYGDVTAAVSEVELDESDVEDLYGHLEKSGIELVEDVDPAQKRAEEVASEGAKGKRGAKRDALPAAQQNRYFFRGSGATHRVIV
jgi:RNA polymerase primary sigma factor